MTLTEQWKKGELKDGYYYAEDGGEELIIHIQGKNGSVMGDDFDLKATDWIKPIAPVPSYEEYDIMKYRSSRFSVRHFEAENQRLKSYLRECREYIGNNFVSPKMRKTLTEIDEVLKWKTTNNYT